MRRWLSLLILALVPCVGLAVPFWGAQESRPVETIPEHETPTEVFIVLQKDKDHRSKTCNDAPMPYTQRLTWDGVALHAGGLPGYPSSHGCVHLPSKFAEELYAVSPMGMTVVVVDDDTAPSDVVHPPAFAPVDARTGVAAVPDRLAACSPWMRRRGSGCRRASRAPCT